jgi:hypothetical protein
MSHGVAFPLLERSLVTDLDPRATSELRSPRAVSFFARAAIVITCLAGVFACAAVEDIVDGDEVSEDDEDDGEDAHEETSDALRTAGACAGTAIDRAVRCATAKGARVLSFYRSPAEQQRVRRENRCRNRCTGMAGCIRPTANCNSSPHTRCRAVDLVNDGAPLTRAQLRACGLAKTTLPHRNHYDLVN